MRVGCVGGWRGERRRGGGGVSYGYWDNYTLIDG